MRAICGNTTLDVLAGETSPEELEVPYRVVLDRKDLGMINLQKWESPGICLGPTHVAVWGGPRVFFASRDAGRLEERDFLLSVRAVYQLPNAWFLVTELAVFLADLETMDELAKIDSDDVIMEQCWEGDVFVIEDFNKAVMRIAVDRDNLRLERL